MLCYYVSVSRRLKGQNAFPVETRRESLQLGAMGTYYGGKMTSLASVDLRMHEIEFEHMTIRQYYVILYCEWPFPDPTHYVVPARRRVIISCACAE